MKTILPNWLDDLRFRARIKLRRYRRALAYARHKLTHEQALDLLYEAQEIAACWALETIDAEGVLIEAREQWEDHPEFARLAEEAASRVASKWDSSGDMAYEARGSALDLFKEYAAMEGITLKEKE